MFKLLTVDDSVSYEEAQKKLRGLTVRLVAGLMVSSTLLTFGVNSAGGALPKPDLKHIQEIVTLNLKKTPTPESEKHPHPFEPDLFWWLQPKHED